MKTSSLRLCGIIPFGSSIHRIWFFYFYKESKESWLSEVLKVKSAGPNFWLQPIYTGDHLWGYFSHGFYNSFFIFGKCRNSGSGIPRLSIGQACPGMCLKIVSLHCRDCMLSNEILYIAFSSHTSLFSCLQCSFCLCFNFYMEMSWWSLSCKRDLAPVDTGRRDASSFFPRALSPKGSNSRLFSLPQSRRISTCCNFKFLTERMTKAHNCHVILQNQCPESYLWTGGFRAWGLLTQRH